STASPPASSAVPRKAAGSAAGRPSATCSPARNECSPPTRVKAPVVRRVFDLYTRRRLGTRSIAEQLRSEGAPAPSAGWGHPAVHWIISNPTYAGKIRWRDKVFDGIHEPLVDEFTFAKAQAILRERGEHAKRRGNASDFLLSGLLRCGRCGKAYIGMSA